MIGKVKNCVKSINIKTYFYARGKMKCPPKNDDIKKVPQISDIIEVAKQNYSEESMGRSKLNIKTGCNNTHFTWGERLKLQYHYNGTNNS